MKNLKVFVLFLFFTSMIFAQQYESWRNFTNTNDVRKITIENNNIWAVTGGGLYKYEISTGVFTTYSKAENLSSQNLTAVTVDRNGMVWVGSREGYINVLNPSNGSITKIYDIYNSSKTQKGINDFSVSGDTLFVSHGFGLSLVNTSTHGFMDNVIKFGSLPTESGVISISKFSKIIACLGEGLAIQKTGSTNLFDPDSWDSYANNSLLMNKAVSFRNEIYVATNKGLYKFSNNNLTLFDYINENVVDLIVQGTNLYALTTTRLYKYSTASEIVFENSSVGVSFSGLAISGSSTFVASNQGVFNLTQTGTSTTIATNSPVINTFMNMDLDSNGYLWVGTGKDANGKGVMKFDGTTWTNFNAAANSLLVTNDYHNVYAGTDNKIYWMNWGNGCAVYQNDMITTYNTVNTPMSGIPSDPQFLVVSDVKNDTKGNTWFLNLWPSDKNVLASLKNNTWQTYNFPSITDYQIFTRLVVDKYNTKWIAVSANLQGGNKGVIAFNESATSPVYNYYSALDGLGSDIVNSLAIDRRGYVWIGTSSGINYISDPSRPVINKPTNASIKNQNISCIAVDALDQKWIGTKSGLYIFSADCGTQIKHYEISNSPLPSNEITSLAIDKKNGIIYIGTDYGLTVLKTDFVEPKESFEEIVTFPSPYLIGDGKETLLKIDGLIKESSIKVLTLTGKLIYEAKTSGGRIGFWNGKDLNGSFVSTGVYYIIAYDQEGNNIAKGKIVLIKK